MKWRSFGLVEIVMLESGIRKTGEKVVNMESGGVVYVVDNDGLFLLVPTNTVMELSDYRDFLIGLIL